MATWVGVFMDECMSGWVVGCMGGLVHGWLGAWCVL